MNIIVGLGNPGDNYEFSRHNAGFMILDNLKEVMQCSKYTANKKIYADICKAKEAVFVRPQTFMNESGKAVQGAITFYKIEKNAKKEGGYHNLFVIHDDLDLSLGSYKIQYGVGPKGHNGLLSIYQTLGTQNFWHVRVGVDNREGERTIPPQKYVLEKFPPNEFEVFKQVRFDLVKELMQKV